MPDVVGAAIADAITKPISNRNTNTESEKNAEEIVLEFRKAVADLIDVDPSGVVYGRSWTQITYDFSRTLAKTWKPGDEIVVSRLDHDSNIRPWIQAAEAVGAKLKDLVLEIGQKAGVDGRLFGSVTNHDIADALKAKGFAIEKASVRMPTGPLKMVGDHPVAVAVHTDVVADITIRVVGEQA